MPCLAPRSLQTRHNVLWLLTCLESQNHRIPLKSPCRLSLVPSCQLNASAIKKRHDVFKGNSGPWFCQYPQLDDSGLVSRLSFYGRTTGCYEWSTGSHILGDNCPPCFILYCILHMNVPGGNMFESLLRHVRRSVRRHFNVLAITYKILIWLLPYCTCRLYRWGDGPSLIIEGPPKSHPPPPPPK